MADFETVHDALDHTGLTGVGGGSGIDQGTAFPGSPSADDLFYHETYDELFFYDGTRWLGHQRESHLASIAATGVSVDTSISYFPVDPTDGMWLDGLAVSMFVPTTNNGSNFWELELDYANSANSLTNIINTLSTVADSANTWVRKYGSIAAVLHTDARVLLLRADETGGPGNLFYGASLRWRRIGT